MEERSIRYHSEMVDPAIRKVVDLAVGPRHIHESWRDGHTGGKMSEGMSIGMEAITLKAHINRAELCSSVYNLGMLDPAVGGGMLFLVGWTKRMDPRWTSKNVNI
jgi:hypothetical protein